MEDKIERNIQKNDDKYSESKLHEIIDAKLSSYYGLSCNNATSKHFYKAVALLTRDILSEKRRDFRLITKNKEMKSIYYLCMEFLIGTQLKNNIYNLGLEHTLEKIMNKYNYTLEDLYEIDVNPGLGNGGLGRLAACFLDSLATCQYPSMGYSICYEFGLFKQKLVDGWQIELPDEWLPTADVFLIPRQDYSVKVKFGGYIDESWEGDKLIFEHKNYQLVEAVPYDLMISGYASEGVSILRLWRAKNPSSINVSMFSQGDYLRANEETVKIEAISKVLYPADNHYEGKTLRLRQEYFFVSASIQNIISRHLQTYPSLDNLHEKCAIHINDTHPTFAIPELMRILMDEYMYEWDDAWKIVTQTMAYTNHTILSEALEKWPESLIKENMPRIYNIICEINRRLCDELWQKYGDWDIINRMSILAHNQVRMANLCIIGGHSVNGVAQLHSDILKDRTFADFYKETPEKFTNVTNGIAHRRWITQANPLLTNLLDECIGPEYRLHAKNLENFKKYKDDGAVLEKLSEIKHKNKIALSNYVKNTYGFALNTDSIFNVQVKRLHEYKRQLLNVLRIISIYNDLRENPNLDIVPETYIFASKAAASYQIAKQTIKLIYCLGEDIKKHPVIRDKLSVVFLEDYSVSLAERIMPASEVSQQISLAGQEASGTGNMKLMINGALTIGTLDGANVEISEAVGEDNIFIFGMTVKQVEDLWAANYDPDDFYVRNDKLAKVVVALNNGFNDVSFNDITQYLLTGNYQVPDPYMCLADFEDYYRVHKKLDDAYKDKRLWNNMSLMNIASAGIFAADRCIEEYATKIWKIAPLVD